MKKLESTKIRILLCSIIVSSIATEHISSHHGVPHHGGTSPPRKKTQSSTAPTGIQLPEKVMSTRYVSCISADSNLLDIMNEAKKTCGGNDMTCTFYLFSNQKYYNIGSLDINKELFDNLLMKYDNWLLTAEKIAEKDTVVYSNGDEKYRERVKEPHTLHESGSLAFTDTIKHDSNISNDEAIHMNSNSNKEHTSHIKNHKRIHANAENEITHINLKEKNGKYIELRPEYDEERKYFEVFLPEDEELGEPRTINVNINYENDNELKEDANAIYKNRRVSNNINPVSTNIHEYDTKYVNENLYHNPGDLDGIDTNFSNKIKPKSLKKTHSYLRQPQVGINDYIDKIDTNVPNDTLIVDTNMDEISSGNTQQRLSQSVNIDSGNQDIHLGNRNLEIIENTDLSKDLPVDASYIEFTSQTNNIIPDIKQDINENIHINTEKNDGPENAHEKHNLTPSQNKTKHLHDLVDQATLNDDYHPHPLEYTNIYNEVDFDDTHLSVHDNDTQLSSHIHLNEPVFIAADSSRENYLETSPFVVAVPKVGSAYQTISDYVGTQIEINPPKNKPKVNDNSTEPITSSPTSHITPILEKIVPEPTVPNIHATNTTPNLMLPSQRIFPEDVASSKSSVLNPDLSSLSTIHDAPGSTLSKLAFEPMDGIIKPHMALEVPPILESAEVFSDKKTPLVGNSLSLTEANSDLQQNGTTICIKESSMTNDLNILSSPDDTSSSIKLDVLPTDLHIEKSTTHASLKSNASFQQVPVTILSEPIASRTANLDFSPTTPFFDMASAKPIDPSRLDNSYLVERNTESLPPNQFQTPTSENISAESKIKPSSLSEASPYLDEKLSQNIEPTSSESMTSLGPENKLLELGTISHDQPLLFTEVSHPQIPLLTDTVLSVVDLQNHLSTEELKDLTKDEQPLDQNLEPLLATVPFPKAKSSNIVLDMPSQDKPIIGVSTPIPSLNYSPSAQSNMIDQLIPHSGISLPKHTSPLPNKDFVAVPSLKPYYSKIPHKPLLNTKLLQNQPSIHNNDNVLQALSNFAKSTKTNPLQDEDYQRLIKELPPDLTNYLLSANADSQQKIPMLDSFKPSVNKIFDHRTGPALDQYTSVDKTTKSTEDLVNLSSTPFTDSKLQTISPSILSTTPLHIQPIAIEQPPNLQQDSSLKPLLPTKLSEFKEGSSLFPQPSLLAEYAQTTPVPTDSFTFASTTSSEPISPIKDFSIVTEANAPSSPLDSKKIVIEIKPITVQPDWSTTIDNQLDIVSPKTLPAPVFVPTPSFETPLTKLELTQYERPVPLLSLDSKNPQFYKELESKPDYLLSKSKTTQFYEESEPVLDNVILETLTPDTTKKSIPLKPSSYKPSQTSLHTKIIPPTLSLVPDDSSSSTYIPATSTLPSHTLLSPVNTLTPLPKASETQYIPKQFSSETILKDLRLPDDLVNLYIGQKPVVLNKLEVSVPKSPELSVYTTPESIISQDYLQKHYATTVPYSPTDFNQLSLTSLMQSDISPSTLSNINLQDTEKLISQKPIQLQSPFIPSASISLTDHFNSFPSSPSASIAPDTSFTLTPSDSSLEFIPQVNVLEHPSKSIPKLPSQFYTPFTYASSVFNKSKDIIPQNILLLTPNSFAHPSLETQFSSPQYSIIPLSPSLLSELSQPSMYAEYELKKELPSIKLETSANMSPLEFANLQQPNLFTTASLEDNFKQLDKPCQKVLQTPLTLPDQSQEFLTVVEPSNNEFSLTFKSNTVPLHPTNTFVNEDICKTIPVTPYKPMSSSPYVPIKPIDRPNWQIPLITKNHQISEPVLYIDSQVANTDCLSLPTKPVLKPLQDITCESTPGSEILNLESYIPVENISPSSVFTPSHSSIVKPLQYIPETTKSKILPNLVTSKYKPICLNDIGPLMDENISQLYQEMTNLPLTQTSKAPMLAAQERPVCQGKILSPFELPISANIILSTAAKPDRIYTSPLKQISPISNYIPVINSPQKLTLPMSIHTPVSKSPIPQNVLSEFSLPVNSVLPFEEISTVSTNVNPCSYKSEILSLPRPLNANLLPNPLSPLQYKPFISKTEFSKNIQPILISSVLEILPQDYSPSFEKISYPKVIPMQPDLPISMPCPTSSPPIYLNPPYTPNYPFKTPYKLQQPIDLKILKDNPRFSTLPVCSRPVGTEFTQPIIEESLFRTASSKSPPTISYTDINFAKLKPQYVSKQTTPIPLKSPSYSTPILLSQSNILPTSPISSQTPQVITPQYSISSYDLKPLELQNIKPMKPQYQYIPNIPQYVESITKPILDSKSQVSSKVPSLPLAILPAVPIVPEYSALPPSLPSPIWIKPSYTKSILSSSPLQPCSSSLTPVYVKPTPEYTAPILPTIQMLPLASYSSLLSPTYAKPPPTYAKHAPLAKSIPMLPIQPDSNTLISNYAMPYTSQIIPSTPLKVHPITPSQISAKPMSLVNTLPVLPALPSPPDFTSLSPSYTLSPYSTPSIYSKPKPPPCKLYEAQSNLYLPEHVTPASVVEAAPCTPSLMSKLPRPVSPQPSISQQSIPPASPVPQHFIPTAISSPLPPKFTQPPTRPYTTPILTSPSSPTQNYMKPLSQKQEESLLSEYITPVSASSYLPIPSPSTKPFNTRPHTNQVSYIDNLLQMNLNSQAKKPLTKSQKLPFNMPSYDTQTFINEIQNLPISSHVNQIKNLPTYRPTSTSASNLQINQNNVIDAVIAPCAETSVLESVTSDIPKQSSFDATIWADATEVTKELSKETKLGSYMESLTNISELDETTKMLLDQILSQGGVTQSISVSSVSNIPVSGTIIHKKSELMPSNILKLEESKEILLNEDLLQGDYRPYTAVRSIPTEPKMETMLSQGPYVTPLEYLQTSTLSTSTLPLESSKSAVIPSQYTSYINPLPETGYSLIKEHPYNVLPLRNQPQPSMLSLPYSLKPATELSKMSLKQSAPTYASTSDLKPIIDNMIFSQGTPQASRIPTTPLQFYVVPYSKVTTPISSLESYESSPNIPYNSPTYIKPSAILPPTSTHKYEEPITTYSALQDFSLPQPKTNIQPLTPLEDLNYITLSNEAPATAAAIDSQSNVTPTQISSSFTTVTELGNSLISPINIEPSKTLDTIEISQSNKLFPLGNSPRYSKLIETVPYYTSNTPCSSFLPSHLKQNTQHYNHQFKIPSITPFSYPQTEKATDIYETIRPHPKLISKVSQEQLNAPISLPLTYTESEFIESNDEPSKPHPKLLAALHQSANLPTTMGDSTSTLNTMSPIDIVPETYIPNLPQYRPTILPISPSSLIRPLIKTNFKALPDMSYKIPEEVIPQSLLSTLDTVEGPLEKISPKAAEICTADQFYSSSLIKTLKNPIVSKESPMMLTEIPSDYVESASQSPLSIIDAQTMNGNLPWLLPSKGPLLKSQLLKPLLTGSHNEPIPPNLLQFLEITPPKHLPLKYEHFTPLQETESLVTKSPSNIDSSTVSSMPNILQNSASTNNYELITEPSNVVETTSVPNTSQNSPSISKYQSLVSMLPCDSQNTLHKSQSTQLNGATMNISPTASPSSLTKYLPLTTADVEFSKPLISQFVSPLVYKPRESFTSLNLPTNQYQSSMLPCDFEDTPHKKQSSPSINSPVMSTYPTVTPSLTQPLSLTSAETEFLKSPIPQFISSTHSPLVRMLYDSSKLKSLESYNTLASSWESGLPTSLASQGHLIAPIPNTTNFLPNQYPSYSQYELLESLPTPEANTMEMENYEEITPSTWSSIPNLCLTPSSSPYCTDISVLTESNQTASKLKSSLPVTTSALLQSKEISQIPVEYSDWSVPVTSSPSLIPIKAKIIGNTDYTQKYSPLTPISVSPISQGFVPQPSSQVSPSPNILQYLPLSTNILINRQNPLQFLQKPINWGKSPIISKSSQFYESSVIQENHPQAENLQIDLNKLIPSSIVTTNIETLKEIKHLQDDLKYSVIDEPMEPISAKPMKPVTPITLKGPNIKYETINPIEIIPYLTEPLQDTPKTKTLKETQPQPSEKIDPKAEASYEKYIDCHNIQSNKIEISKMSEIPQYLPLNNFYTYSPYISSTAKVPEAHKAPTSDIKAPHITPKTLNPESISEYTNFYANNHIGNTPNLFSIPTEISSNYNALPVNSVTSEICNDLTSNKIEYIDSVPDLKAIPLALNECKTINPIDTPVTIYNQENYLTPCLKSSPKIKFSSSPIEICQTPIKYTEIPCQTTSLMPDRKIKYHEYKTYYPSSKTSTEIPYSLPSSQYQNQMLETPLQAELELDKTCQGLKLDNYEHIPGVHENKEVGKELKSILINYINSKKDLKNNLFTNDAELTIPLGDLAINKKDPSDYKTVETNNPSIGLKVWKSNAKIVTAELKLKTKQLSVNNFMPVVNNLNEIDLEEIRKIVKKYIDEKYGNHIEIHEPYRVDNQYVVLKDVDLNAFDNKFNLLWPAEYV